MDEFDIEVTDLHEQNATAISADHHTGHDDHNPAQSGVRTPLGKHLSRRQRLFRSLAVVATILLALALILGANPTTRAALGSLLHLDTTFADSTAPRAEEFDLVHIAPWGDLRIDGQSVSQKQVLQRFRAITLAPGTHTLDYSAPPFAPLHCSLTVPADTVGDTCPLSNGDGDAPTLYNDAVRELDLRASFTNLSPQQLAVLIKVAEAGLAAGSPTATVAPGEHYLTAGGTITNMSGRSVQATLLYRLSTEQTRQPYRFEGFPCQTLCLSPYLIDQAPLEWGVVAHIALSWSYTMPHGPIVSGPVTPDHDTMDVGIPLHITWQHGWRVTPLKYTGGPFGNPICMPAQQALYQATVGTSSSANFAMRPAPDADGCIIEWSSLDPATNAFTPPCYLLYRFGVLLAANDQAHRAFLTLPLADAYEQALATSYS